MVQDARLPAGLEADRRQLERRRSGKDQFRSHGLPQQPQEHDPQEDADAGQRLGASQGSSKRRMRLRAGGFPRFPVR